MSNLIHLALDSHGGGARRVDYDPHVEGAIRAHLRETQAEYNALLASTAGNAPTRIDAQGRQVAMDASDLVVLAGRNATRRMAGESAGRLKSRIDSGESYLAPLLRADAYPAVNGFALPLQTTFVDPRVLAQPLPELTAARLFPNRPGIDPWWEEYALQRESLVGEARFIDGSNSDIPVAQSGRNAEKFPIFTVAISVNVNLIEGSILSNAGISKFQEDQKAARRAIAYLVNQSCWFGNSANGLKGFLNYPGIGQIYSAVTFSTSATPADMLSELLDAANYAMSNSRGVFMNNTMFMSPRLYAILNTTPWSALTGDSVLQIFRNRMPAGYRIEIAQELTSADPLTSTYDGIWFGNSDPDASSIVLPGDMQSLAPQFVGFDTKYIMYARFGGVACPNAGSTNILWCPVA